MLRIMMAAAMLSVATLAQAAEREFYSGYIGIVPPDAGDQAKTYFDRPEVRRLLAQMETGPVTDAAATALLVRSQTQLADLVRLRLVRESNGYLRLGFPYFTAADMDMIHAVAAKYVPALVAAYQAKAPQLDAILARYPVASVDRRRLAFVVLAGFSLNWDALDLLTQKNYRQPLMVEGPTWHYGFWASESVPGTDYKGYYWGSTSFPADRVNLDPPLDVTFSSFGDPDSDPRMNLPDLLAMPADQMTAPVRAAAEALGLKDDAVLGMDLKQVVGLSRARDFAAILFAARAGAATAGTLCPENDTECTGELGLLVAAGYLKTTGERYALLVPVLDAKDKAMLDAALALSRGVIADWLARNYAPMHRELLRLTAVRQGIPYAVLFSQIWHELFGLTTRQLAAGAIIEDPRGEGALWPGSIPAVWRTSLYHHDWQ